LPWLAVLLLSSSRCLLLLLGGRRCRLLPRLLLLHCAQAAVLPLKLTQHFPEVWPISCTKRQAPLSQFNQPRRRNLSWQLRQAQRAVADVDHQQEHWHVLVSIRPLPRQQLMQHDAKGVDVAALRVGLTTQDLWRAVLNSAFQARSRHLQLQDRQVKQHGTG
jgi:hypothetical protein